VVLRSASIRVLGDAGNKGYTLRGGQGELKELKDIDVLKGGNNIKLGTSQIGEKEEERKGETA